MQVNLLGSLEVVEDGVPLTIPGEKLRAILAALALTPGTPVSRDDLIDELWSGRPPRNAENSLQGHIARLRRILAERTGKQSLRGVIQTSYSGYVLAVPGHDVDALRFHDLVVHAETAHGQHPRRTVTVLTEALRLWRGPALLDAGHGAICRAACARLAETRLTAREQLFDAKLKLDMHRSIITELEQLHVQYPLRERFCEQLMTALYRSGRQADALDAYHRTRQRLAQDLGLEPGQGLRAKFHEILRQDPALL
jgi:DNA-binding SARP family transcriptional activator